ncbi:DUF1016 N-terminal domain-containing protein [Variovorax sp. PBS-H4]|uniref:DUF1016 N-terminal domain-containing protein n=1 Tax=Variovorax sp. PBS-H4 TaxID=434008 RepID=UPI003FCDD42C
MLADRQTHPGPATRTGLGARVIDRLAADLRREMGEQRGWSRSNPFSMRALATLWPDPAIVQQVVGRLPWGPIIVLLNSPTRRNGTGTTAVPPTEASPAESSKTTSPPTAQTSAGSPPELVIQWAICPALVRGR